MSANEIASKVKELREMQRLIEEAEAEAEALKDEIKAFMGDREEITAGEYKVTYKTVTTSRIDTTALRKLFSAEDLKPYTRTTTTRRFAIA